MINIAIQNLEKSNKNSYEFINEKQELFVSSYNKKTGQILDIEINMILRKIILWCDCPYLRFFKFFWAG